LRNNIQVKKRWGMSLFKKDKDTSLPSHLSEEEQATAFERILAEVPPPPSRFSPVGKPTGETLTEPEQIPEPEPISSEKELPTFETDAKKGPEIEEGFELPDFDDKDIRELGDLKVKEGKVEEKPVKEEKVEKKPEPPRPPPKISYPEPQKPLIKPEPRFIDINKYFYAREVLDKIRFIAEDTERGIGRHGDMSKSKGEIYKSLGKDLNIIQDKLIFVDSQLFEGI
jgi:hypothetical protein